MKTLLFGLLCTTVVLWGCSETKYMSNEEIAKEINFCRSNWLGYRAISNWRNYKVKYIICR